MPDVSIITTAISTAGALAGALGGVAFTHGVSARREERDARRRRAEERANARTAAYLDLLGTAEQFKIIVGITAQRHWRDMDGRLNAIQDRATIIGQQASRVALLCPGEVGTAARDLAAAAGQLAAEAMRRTQLGYEADRFLGGEMTSVPDFGPFGDCVKHLYHIGQIDFRRWDGADRLPE